MSPLMMRKNADGTMKLYKKQEQAPQETMPATPEAEDAKGECIDKLLCYNAGLQVAHWQADTATNEHKALGDLYETMVGLLDTFAEVHMGKYGVIGFPNINTIEDISDAPCQKGLDILATAYEEYADDEDLMNILADMGIAINKAKYLLKEGV